MCLTRSVVGEVENGTHSQIVWIRFGMFQAVVDAPGVHCHRKDGLQVYQDVRQVYHSAKPTKSPRLYQVPEDYLTPLELWVL